MGRLVDEIAKLPDNLAAMPESEHVALIRKWHKAAQTAKAELKIETQRRELIEKELEDIQDFRNLIESTEGSVKAHRIKKLKRSSGSEAMPIFDYGDWHLEERIESAEVNGLNEYNLDIATERVETACRKMVMLHDFTQHLVPLKCGKMIFGGDMINGWIHEELRASNFLGPAEAVLLAQDLMAGVIDYTLANTKLEHIEIVCKLGNHARTTQKQHATIDYKSSWEYVAYRNLAKVYANNPRLSWRVDVSYHSYMEVFDWVYRVHHGEGMKYNGGVGGLTIPANKAIAQWNKSRRADYDIIHHWHTFFSAWNFFVNGSLVGFNGYAVRIKADYQPPLQSYLVCDRDRGNIMALPVYCDKVKVRAS